MNLAPASSDLLYFFERGSGPPLLLIHGMMATGEMFAPVLDHFASRHRVIVPDLRGHGRSRGLPPPYTVSQLASDLSRLLDHLGIASTAVLGYSQGGAIAQQLVLDDPARCNHLVLACTYAYNMATLREKLEGHSVPFLLRILGVKLFVKLVITLGAKQFDEKTARWLGGIMASQDTKLMVSAWKEAMAFDSRSRLAEIKCPTLIIAGSSDQAVPMHHATVLHDGIIGSKLVIVSGADHTLIWTRPADLLRATDDFLAV
jgi:pimeloyl-ACP methyl ester carboxylesterase